jgi:electron transport complex protein RnfD
LLLGSIIICAFIVNRSWIPAIFLGVFGFLSRLAGSLPFGGDLWTGDALFAICSGGTLAAAFFLAADPATSAKSNICIAMTAAAAGGIAFLFRFYGGEPYGAVYSIVLMNALLPLVRIAENRLLYQKQGNV